MESMECLRKSVQLKESCSECATSRISCSQNTVNQIYTGDAFQTEQYISSDPITTTSFSSITPEYLMVKFLKVTFEVLIHWNIQYTCFFEFQILQNPFQVLVPHRLLSLDMDLLTFIESFIKWSSGFWKVIWMETEYRLSKGDRANLGNQTLRALRALPPLPPRPSLSLLRPLRPTAPALSLFANTACNFRKFMSYQA
ncbi:hypothetical protein GCK72_000278 [Caenorhabditis remanei]|uniref:Uncharacterized protein n=1 Tax=Caenorhabditis remanei TaxID=31234 RepID=A0A6A5HP71_CAERE|nr:hypothetical protein GCK72_000278 [Caenorhabditis remanei]KAF1768466.1 hypothetical protein GCK72_000278 [Caenorhabditis remanei]